MEEVNPLEKEWEKRGLLLREYQKAGVMTMDSWYRDGHGGINGDEMGLGKTCQAIVLMLRLRKVGKGPFLVVCPLSVCDHWINEVSRFSCETLQPIGYFGQGSDRHTVLKKLGKLEKNTVFIVPYHIFRADADVIDNLQKMSRLSFNVVIVDEAHAVKNSETQLAESLKPYKDGAWFLLLTGTPIQNNLGELYSLFTFVDPNRFDDSPSARKSFIERYTDDAKLPELRRLLNNYLIRRTKDEECKELPFCEQVILYHNLSDLQKKLYIDIIAKDYDNLLGLTNNQHQSLNNLHMQLRKCVAHPYLFKGIEPEPFKEGEHIVEASGKFQILDRLLKYLKEQKHRCLIFSQFVVVLDIVQDFMNLRGYDYERLDGSIRAEERYAAINEFQNATRKSGRTSKNGGPWCFLLTTKSGGVGLNLTGADTVIFLDADWNPQNDIQAMARCHRIGQDKPVRVIRLIGRYTVEQHMHARIRDKLKFTDRVMGNEEMKLSAFDLLAMVKQSLYTLREQKNDKFKLTDRELESVIGQTSKTGEWLQMKDDKENEVPAALRLDPDEVDKRDTDSNDYRTFEGRQYRVSAKDEAVFEELRFLRATNAKRPKRRLAFSRRYDEAEVDEDMAKRIKVMEKERATAAEKRRKDTAEKKAAVWAANGYTSFNLPPTAAQEAENSWQNEIQRGVEEGADLFYVHGDVTKPQRSDDDVSTRQLILHCVDNSGNFGNGGVFKALRAMDPTIAERYGLIAQMGDMRLGDSHLIADIKDLRDSARNDEAQEQSSLSSERHIDVILFVAQSSKHRGVIRPAHLEHSFSRIGEYACHHNASVHMARIGYGTSLSWYTVERLVRKYITNRGVPTYIYYFARPHRPRLPPPPAELDASSSERTTLSPRRPSKRQKMGRSGNDIAVSDEEEEDEDGSSHTSSSTFEPSWSGEDEVETDVESSNSSIAEDIDDEELEELDIERKPELHQQLRRRNFPVTDAGSSGADQTEDDRSAANNPTSSGYHTPEKPKLFEDMAVSLYAVEGDIVNNVADIIVNNGGYLVDEKAELTDATHAIVPAKFTDDSNQLEEFTTLFNKNCIFLTDKWFSDSVKSRSRLDTVTYEVHCK